MISPDDSVEVLRGVGVQRAEKLAKLGIATVADLARNFPRDYEDRTVTRSIAELAHGETACIIATVVGDARTVRTGSRDYVRCRIADGTGAMELFFFNQPYVRNMLRAGENYVFYGRAEREFALPSMVNPVFEHESARGGRTGCIVPVYRLTAGVSQYQMAGAVKAALSALSGVLPDASPRRVRETYGLCETGFAFDNIHFPRDPESLAVARRRLVFDELLTLAVAARRHRALHGTSGGRVLDTSHTEAFVNALPFTLTGAQKSAIDDAARDVASGAVMSRLIQGDVGSGKTAVAMALCYLAAKNGAQSAFMAPTELLAEQHYRTFTKILEPLGVNVALVKGGMKKSERADVQRRLLSGEIDIAIGTHALISESTEYRDLALVVTDEQHRFGVTQRAKLGAKGGSPHVLVMSATPIPRSLALILYGDLDVSVIGELPPGRTPVKTYAVDETFRARIYAFARRLVTEGRQVYFICPSVEESEVPSDLISAKEHAKKLAAEVFPDLHVGLVHGSMRPKEKDAAMTAFASGETQILVATTVVEVGVDVPNAALMVVENADRYGLSQLHQLRGRVGRGTHESFCVLFRGADGESSRERLDALCRTNDGFEIAEQDLKQRGPGDFYGQRQHGLPSTRFADALAETNAVLDARSAAEEILRLDPELAMPEHNGLRSAVERVFAESEGTFN